jgi:hypothetical protein
VKNRVNSNHRRSSVLARANVSLDEIDAGESIQVAPAARGQIVKDSNFGSLGNQATYQMRTDKTGTTGDKCRVRIKSCLPRHDAAA